MVSLLRERTITSMNAAVLGKVHVEVSIIPFSGQEQESKGKAGDQEKVENAKEDETLGGANAVTAIGQAPSDGIEEPEQIEVAGEKKVVSAGSEAASRSTAKVKSLDSEKKPGNGAPGEETPLVVGLSVCTAEVRDDPAYELVSVLS